MRKYSWVFGIFIMLLCIGFGLFFPNIVFSNVLNENLGQVEKYQVNPIEITHSNSIIEAMRAVYYKDYEFDYQEDMANLSGEELAEVCNSFLQGMQLEEWGYAQPKVDKESMDAKCSLLVIKDSSVSAVIWTVKVKCSTGNEMILYVDDKNKKVIQVNYNVIADNGNSVAYCSDDKNSVYVRDALVLYLEDYYGLRTELDDDDGVIIKLVDENKDEILMSVYLYDGLELIPFEYLNDAK